MLAGRADYDAQEEDRKKEKEMLQEVRRRKLKDMPGFEDSEKEREERVQQLFQTE